MENIQILDDVEEARPLTSSSQSPRQPLTKSFRDRTNKLLHYLIGITIIGAVIVFFPSYWTVVLQSTSGSGGNTNSDDNGGIFGSSRISKLRRSDATTKENYTIKSGSDDDEWLIPSCAEQTFLTLYTELPPLLQSSLQRGGDEIETIDEQQRKNSNSKNACKGMLLRDDIILTTHECSQTPTLYFQSSSASEHSNQYLETAPHTTLNANMGLHSKLGFLEVKDVPYHYLFSDHPVRRARMFLSLRSHPDVMREVMADDDDYYASETSSGRNGSSSNNGSSSISPYITCKGYKPIIHNFPLPNGQMIPIGEELHTIMGLLLPDDILWEHTDLDTAIALKNSDTKERWWSKAITLEEGEAEFQRYFDRPEIRGPEGSLSIVRAHNGFIGKASGISEKFDPRGHRGQVCFFNYLVRWRDQKPFSGMHFMDWVDYGMGRSLFERNQKYHFLPELKGDLKGQVTDEKCVKSRFNKRTVHFFNDVERSEHEIYLTPSSENGKDIIIVRYIQSDDVVGPTKEGHPHLYMFDMNKRMYVVDKNLWDDEKYGKIKHTAVLDGMPALSAGEAYFREDGVMEGINYSSGHYRPKIAALTMMYQWMKEQGLNTTAFQWMARKQWSTEDCDETDWEGMEIEAFDVKVLEEACREVSMSPTWTFKDD